MLGIEGKMKRNLLLITLIATMVLTACAGGSLSSEEKELVLATGGTGGTYFAVGSAMSTVFNPKLEKSGLSVLSTGGSKANIQMLSEKAADLAIVQNDVMYYAYSGTDLFAEEGQFEKFSAVAGLYDETVQIVTCDESLKTVADLKGKTVSVGDAGSGTEFNSRQILEAYGMSFDDINVVNASFADSAAALGTGKIDAAIIVAGAPTKAVTELAEEKGIRLIEMDAEHIRILQSKYLFYKETTIPKDTYEGLPADSTTVSVRATLVASDKVQTDQVYELTKMLFEENGSLASAHKELESLTPESALVGLSIPLHPGAKKYYDEAGLQAE